MLSFYSLALKYGTEADCTYTTNDLGECGGCNQQFFINEECDEAFYCSTNAVAQGQEGCSLKCDGGQVKMLIN